MMMAQKSGAAIIPVGISATRRWLAPAWDSYMVPLPFSSAVMLFGEPVYVPAEASDAEKEAIRVDIQNRILEIEAEAERMMGHG